MSKHKEYLWDLGAALKERALEARVERDNAPPGSSQREFELGRVIAFNEVISIMLQQAEGFDISPEELQLNDIEPDRDLV